METETTFGVWLRQQRRERDWTQAELAQRVGYSLATIRKLERDELRPSKHLAQQLAYGLDVAVTYHASLVSFARSTPAPGLESDLESIHAHRRSNLPSQLTLFFGRTDEIAELTQLHDIAFGELFGNNGKETFNRCHHINAAHGRTLGSHIHHVARRHTSARLN